MAIADSRLKKMAAVSTKDLLVYLAAQPNPVALQLITSSGRLYQGNIVNCGADGDRKLMLVLQLSDSHAGLTDNFLHLPVSAIESVELTGHNAPDGLSLGKLQANYNYTVAGKLDVQRTLKSFAEAIYNSHGVPVGIPSLVLPADGQALSRIVRLTETIHAAVSAVLKESDAQRSWKEKYTSVAFCNNDVLQVEGNPPVITIHFAFNDIGAPEISAMALQDMLLKVL